MQVVSNGVGQQAELSPQAHGALTEPAEATPDKRILSRLTLEDLPIPPDIKVHEYWPPLLAEMADHIGAYDTLRVVDAFAGRDVYFPMDVERSPFTQVIGREKATILSHVYGRERLPIPTGSDTLLHAKRQGVIAAIRAGRLSVVQGASILRMARRHVSRLVNKTDEGIGYAPIDLPEPRVLVALREAAQIAAEQLRALSAPFDAVEATTTKILDIFFKPTSPQKGLNDDHSAGQ
ncbi:hypothetical protein [Novosphingobium sp. LASN5T]|uniref:hypothetical protein n=1 Tax=Novosphingobium sp. LASN5T TaxID=2491021 RepID=UPI000F5E4D14|nr:hypothetical protein [Novosphingobium sp. LASN5T]RQW45310.1 hypothetical protein EH199_05320 [Novosphingobium sp. LASN5T]